MPAEFEEAIRETQVKQQDWQFLAFRVGWLARFLLHITCQDIQIATLEQKTKTVTFKNRWVRIDVVLRK